MRLYTILRRETPELAVSFEEGALYPLAENGFAFAEMQQLIEAYDADLRKRLDALRGHGAAVSADSVKLCAPIIRPRQDVICLGINYFEHAVEAASFSEEAFGGERPCTIYFSKRCGYAPGTGETVPSYPGLVGSLDYEAELGVVLGRAVRAVPRERALDAVFGYTVINDISARDLQTRHKQWYLGKSLDGFTPMGPCIVTADEIPDPQCLAISSRVNGELRQSSNTSLQIQTVAGAISELSQGMTLLPGTIIATGTPSGVGMGFQPPRFLKPGDEVICEVERIGALRNIIGR